MLLYDGEAQIVHPTRTMTIVYPYSFANRARHIVAIITTSMSLIATTVAAELPSTVIAALKAGSIPARNVSVAVLDVDSGRPLIRHNAQQAMNPASAMKLITTYAALEMLGPAHTWKTDTLADAAPVDGTLNGNLYLRGSGDPRLALEQFWLLLRQLRLRGIARIQGDLVLDRSAFSLPPHDPAQFDNEPLRPYNAGADALLINLKSLSLTLQPAQESVAILAETPGVAPYLNNRLKLSNESCGDWREKINVELSGETITLHGNYARSCGAKSLNLSPWSADLQIERLFRALWRELGGSLEGQVRAGTVPPGALLLTQHESPALGEIVREINKYSNNVMASQVFLTLDAARPATPAGARKRIQTWLDEKSLAMPELALDNGSGLSREERISADNLARLLLAAWQSPVMPELMASLPVAGIDGTLKKRLGNQAATGRAHLKTGYLSNVRALAGYVLDTSGKRWIVVALINDPNARNGKPAMDLLLQGVAERLYVPDGNNRAGRESPGHPR